MKLSKLSWCRQAPLALKTGALLVLIAINTACAGTQMEQKAEKISLVDAWNMKMVRKDANHVLISYQPLLSSAVAYPGANIKSDGKTLQVSLPKCAVNKQCSVAVPSKVIGKRGEPFWYEVIVPYQGERVLVDGNGPVVEELPMSH